MDNNHYFTIDFGVNFADKNRYDEQKLDKIMKESWDSGVDKVVCISNTIKEAKYNLQLAKKYENLYFTLGVHPHDAKHFRSMDLKFIEENLTNPKCFGIGECGLDFNRNFSPQDKQIEAFEEQLKLAKKTNSKLYIHCRDAHEKLVEILKKHEYYNGLVHCFTGTKEEALELTSLGFRLGITGWLLDKRRNQSLVEAIKDERITIDMLVVETDAPWLCIHRKKKESVPADTGFIVEEIARLKNIDNVLCGKTIYQNSLHWLNNISAFP